MSRSYDEVAYPSLPLAQTQPDRMAVVAQLRGLPAADPRHARVLEIGCSDSGNLAALAAYAPQAEFVGIDLSEAAVARGREATGSLPNLRLVQADLRDFDEGGFDFVIAHGVYSWIPRPQDLLECVERNLAEQGVGYVSYDVKPGAHLRTMVAEVLLRESRNAEDPVTAARAVLDAIGQAQVSNEYAEALRAAVARTAGKPDHVLAHDELSAHHHPVYFDEFAAAAAAVGLHYLGESHPSAGARAVAGAPDGDEIQREQWWDYASNRTFRQSLLVRGRPGAVSAANLAGLLVAAPTRIVRTHGPRATLKLLKDAEATLDDRTMRDELLRLGAAWPRCLAIDEMRSPLPAWLQLFLAGAVEIRRSPVACVRAQSTPRVVDYMRDRAGIDGLVTSARHEVLKLEDEMSRRAVAMMDGHTSRAALAEELRAHAAPGTRVRKDLDGLIEGLAAAGLFVGEDFAG